MGSAALVVLIGGAGVASPEGSGEPGPDLTGYLPILLEDFSGGLSRYDGMTGVWSTDLRRDVLVTNSSKSVFLDGEEAASGSQPLGLDPFVIEEGILRIRAAPIPESRKPAVDRLLAARGQGRFAPTVRYYTGQINTMRTWAQTYGYFEIVARMPVGRGRWPAFWLSAAGLGWPPEIDVLEAYGKGLTGPTPKDDVFNTAVFFDEIDAAGNATQRTDIVNPHALDENGAPQAPQVKGGGRQHVFNRRVDARARFGTDIYESFHTYGMEWTPDEIVFYFGKDRESLQEVHRTPTPADLNSPMIVIANDQVGTKAGVWEPVPGQDDLAFAPGNDFAIASISIYARRPDRTVGGDETTGPIVDSGGSSRIVDTPGDDVIVPGDGLDVIDLQGGRDLVFVDRETGGKIVSGFGADDRLVLEGLRSASAEEVLARLTQVGDDVWFADGVDPADPETVIFRNARVGDFRAEQFVVRWPVTRDVWSSALHDATLLRDADGDGVVRAAPGGSRLADVGPSRAVTLVGSPGPDLYSVTRSDTVIAEPPDGGVDTVRARASFALPENVENLISIARKAGAILEGNHGANRLLGGPEAEELAGGGGDDLVDLTAGGADRVVYAPGDGHDTLVGFGPDDVLILRGIRFPSREALRARLADVDGDAVLDLGTGGSVTFRAVPARAISPESIVFETGPTKLAGHGVDPYHRPAAGAPWPPGCGSDGLRACRVRRRGEALSRRLRPRRSPRRPPPRSSG